MIALCRPENTFLFMHGGGHEIPGIGIKTGLLGTVEVARRAISTAEMNV
jgi:hypothetical protein